MGKRELVALLRCLVMVERLFLTVPRGCLRFVIVIFPDHTHLLFLYIYKFHYSHAFYFIYMCSICPKLTEYVEMKEL